jgi:hypothetical protein
MKKNKQLITIIILGVLLVLLTACSREEPADLNLAGTYAAQTLAAMPSDTATVEPSQTELPTAAPTETLTSSPTLSPTIGPVGPVDFPENVNPLTGLPVEDPSILDRRPVFVKVANYPISGRPHAGLSSADMVFEYYIGGGGNRFIGLYYGQDADMIGPVRSGRLVDPYLVSLYEGILGMVSADPTVFGHIRDILDSRVISDKTLCPGICDDGRNIVTSVFANSEALTQIVARRGVINQRYVLEGMAFDMNAPDGGQEANQVAIRFSQVNPDEWRYDQGSGYYLRWIDNAEGQDVDLIPLVDRVNDQQLAFSNVVVLFAIHDEITPTLHDISLWDNYSGQRAVVFRDGQAYDLTWRTPSRTQPIQFIDSEGEAFRLKPGNTWVVIMGLYSGVTSVDGTWTFNFFMP